MLLLQIRLYSQPALKRDFSGCFAAILPRRDSQSARKKQYDAGDEYSCTPRLTMKGYDKWSYINPSLFFLMKEGETNVASVSH